MMDTWREIYISQHALDREKELGEWVINELSQWDNSHAQRIIIENAKAFMSNNGMSENVALLSAYTLSVIASTDYGGEKICPSHTTPSHETAIVAPNGNSKRETWRTALHRRVSHVILSARLSLLKVVGK